MNRAIVLFCSVLALAACAPLVPPPPVPPPPGPMAGIPPHVFTVYFGWNRSKLGREGIAVLQQAAAVFRAGGAATVHVTGYTDTSGAAGYNRRLSVRRAQTVSHILAHMGVPRKAVAIAGAGETNLAVPTPDGIREPRNRRVTIVE
jgi:OmpA-OmpF porin, OOP family